MKLRYLSLFSGIEACSVAWHDLGWEPVAFSEVKPYACRVLSERYPLVPNLGDITKITANDIKRLGRIDLVVGGSPCQDISTARAMQNQGIAGLDGTRSRLFNDYIRVWNYAHKHCGARFLLWENVTAIFSTNNENDFARVLGAMGGGCIENRYKRTPGHNAGLYSGPKGLVEFRILDAKGFGVPATRQRTFALLDTGDWPGRRPILLEPGAATPEAVAVSTRRQNSGIFEPLKDARNEAGGWFKKKWFNKLTSVRQKLPVSNNRCDDYSRTLLAYEKYNDLLLSSPVVCYDAKGKPVSIRSLTVLEQEKCMGFPPGYSNVPSDDWKHIYNIPSREDVLGNSMAVPVMRFIGERIVTELTAAGQSPDGHWWNPCPSFVQ